MRQWQIYFMLVLLTSIDVNLRIYFKGKPNISDGLEIIMMFVLMIIGTFYLIIKNKD